MSFPQEFGIAHRPWLIGLISTAPGLFSISVAWVADPLNGLIGRRGAIFVSDIFVLFPVLAQAFTHSWQQLFICRMFLGFGMAIKKSTIPIYTAEIAPARIRGALVISWQMWVAFGIMLGMAFNLAFKDLGKLAWRFQLASAFMPAVPMLYLIWLCPGQSNVTVFR